ncbi:hypothetical protein ACFPM0_33655 [Pseudonocardia sulfidoxydans]|uniref:hypothetical protein n=1 Tax=Pseudonocardia sulfidoxydans TaxID=54011 RepID=UPI00361C8009
MASGRVGTLISVLLVGESRPGSAAVPVTRWTLPAQAVRADHAARPVRGVASTPSGGGDHPADGSSRRARGPCCVALRAGRRVGARLRTTVRVTCPESPRSDGAHER